MERPPYEIALMHDHILRIEEELKAKKQECENLREAMRKNRCTHYVLGECSQNHHNNCVGKKQCIKDLERECEKLKEEKQGLIKDWEEKKNLAYEIACKNEKLKQTLKEIKEILNSQVWRIGDDKTIEKINQIISEII